MDVQEKKRQPRGLSRQGNGSPRMSAVSAGPVPQEADGDEMERPRSRASINRDSPEPSSLTMLLRGAADITPRGTLFGSKKQEEDPGFSMSDALDPRSLTKLQGLWEEHSSRMDTTGEKFVEAFEKAHTATLGKISRIPNFDLKLVLSEMQAHAGLVRALVMENYQQTRALEGYFASTLYQTARDMHVQGIQSLVLKSNHHHRDKMRGVRQQTEEQLHRERVSAREVVRVQLLKQEASMAKQMQKDFDAKLEAIQLRESKLSKQVEDLQNMMKSKAQEAMILQNEIEKRDAELKTLKARNIMSAAQDKEKAALEKKKQLEKAKDKPMDEQDLVKHYEEKIANVEQLGRIEISNKDREISLLKEHLRNMQTELNKVRESFPGGSNSPKQAVRKQLNQEKTKFNKTSTSRMMG